MLDFVGLQGTTATFAPKRGMREVLNFAKGPMGNRLAASLSEPLGFKVQLAFLDQTVDTGDGATGANIDASSGSPASGNPSSNTANNTGNDLSSTSAHSIARGLPLVRKALETFPDAVMIDARKLPPGTMPPPPQDGSGETDASKQNNGQADQQTDEQTHQQTDN